MSSKRITVILRLALSNAGGIRASFDKGNITLADLMTAFPFQNTFDIIKIKGQFIRQNVTNIDQGISLFSFFLHKQVFAY